MAQYPTHPNNPLPETSEPDRPPMREPLASDLPPALEIVRSTVDQALQRMQEQNERVPRLLTEILEAHRVERGQHKDERASVERQLQSLLAATQRVESLVTSTGSLLERETATLTAARRQLWDEAAAFKREVRREIRWFLRAPLVALLLLAFGIGVLWMHREPTPESTEHPPVTQPTQRRGPRR